MHRSQPVYPELLATATDVIVVTQGHGAMLMGRFPNVGPRPQLLNDRADVSDPIGGDMEEYRACARQIAEYLEPFIRGWLQT
jgi:protein-tyrosine-phosphatase